MQAGTAVVQLVEHLGGIEEGLQVALLAAGLPERLGAQVVAGPAPAGVMVGGRPDVPLHEVPLAGTLQPIPDLQAVAAVRRLLQETGAPILHSHSLKAGAIGRLAALGRGRRVRTVHTFHGPELPGEIPADHRSMVVGLERQLARRSDALVALDEAGRDELLAHGIGRAEQYRVIPIGLDLDPFRQVAGDSGALRAAIGVPGDVPLAGALGPLEATAEHPVLLRALTEVPGLHLALVGDGKIAPALKESARQLGLADRVHFTGPCCELASALADLDLVVVARPERRTSAVVLEALAAGRPVVAADAPGVRGVVEHGLTGWLVPAGDAAALAFAIRQATSRPVEAMSRANRGRQQVLEAFSVDRMVAAHVELYEALLAEPATRSAG